ncbi:UDP-N-acetylglucosamine 2-epimerase (non-hydrolyzing) [Kitasatospora atroaurantiaca]|uniref:UDP-N-acetylglucosamine 2-epimerase (non-hydrolyzing) n=1 Tax=Kitasatospora atroaurantiaca TaxID=285545 RepID=A0A561EZX1_9ACTN|nr:UDP-N-acetylglucosamine 2-epimerase (non-hydrolyzing) [Kitasatospora atroaurantiaca]TWE21158.1 UDP-N-acetylglucosamine 2-epimerase (non-hydrolysing) [Kitasatospora atroaurantiaca]
MSHLPFPDRVGVASTPGRSQHHGFRPLHAAVILGTRPEAVKLAPVLRALEDSEDFAPLLINTGQHREMLYQMLTRLQLQPHYDLGVMTDRQQLSDLTALLIGALGEVLRDEGPDLVIVQGDTTSTLCGALAAFYERIPVAHVEAGLRSGVLDNPFPEELNRLLVSRLARWHFAPTERAGARLHAEGIPADSISVTGNTVIDNLLWVRHRGAGRSAFRTTRRGILVTLHRRENQGDRMRAMAATLLRLAQRSDVEILLPVHRSPAVRDVLVTALRDHPHITLTDPLDYFDFTASLAASELVLTDSGGVQEEAPSLDKPVLVLRATTERPEVVSTGAARLVGTDPDAIHAAANSLLDDPALYRSMADAPCPFGDGRAAQRIVTRLAEDFAATPTAGVAVGAATADVSLAQL